MKYCFIRKVPVRTPGKKPRIMWGQVLAEHQGVVLVVVPKPDADQPHKIFFASENVTERLFEPVSDFEFHVSTEEFISAADRLRVLGKQFDYTDFCLDMRLRKRRDDDAY